MTWALDTAAAVGGVCLAAGFLVPPLIARIPEPETPDEEVDEADTTTPEDLTDLGTIERGKLADLTIVDGNPLVTITDIRKTRRVVKDGVVYEVATLVRGPARASATSVGSLKAK